MIDLKIPEAIRLSLTGVKKYVDNINNNLQESINNIDDLKADKSELFSGDYNDLSNKPNIPSIEGLATESYVDNKINEVLSGLSITKVTQAEYDALTIKDPNTLYIIIQ